MTSKRIPMSVICGAVLASGCTTTTLLPPQAPQVAYRDANDKLAGRNAQVRTTAGGLFELYNVQITADSVSGLSPFRGPGSQFAQGGVFEIRTNKNRTRGGFIGGAIGAGIGLLLLVVEANQDPSASTDGPAAGAYAISWAMGGVIIGAIRGSRTQYRFLR